MTADRLKARRDLLTFMHGSFPDKTMRESESIAAHRLIDAVERDACDRTIAAIRARVARDYVHGTHIRAILDEVAESLS